jgi:aspartate/methionine/tyrosine aminotransferase
MDPSQLADYVQALQVRRLASYNIYRMGQEAKQRATDEKDKLLLSKVIERFAKKHDTVLKALNELEKLATDIQAARIATGDL